MTDKPVVTPYSQDEKDKIGAMMNPTKHAELDTLFALHDMKAISDINLGTAFTDLALKDQDGVSKKRTNDRLLQDYPFLRGYQTSIERWKQATHDFNPTLTQVNTTMASRKATYIAKAQNKRLSVDEAMIGAYNYFPTIANMPPLFLPHLINTADPSDRVYQHNMMMLQLYSETDRKAFGEKVPTLTTPLCPPIDAALRQLNDGIMNDKNPQGSAAPNDKKGAKRQKNFPTETEVAVHYRAADGLLEGGNYVAPVYTPEGT